MPFTSEQSERFEELYKKCRDSKDDSSMVAEVYEMLEILLRANFAYEVTMSPLHVGIHPKNRSGKKMVGATMQKKGMKVHKVGFALALCGTNKAIAFENNPMTLHCEKHTLTITRASPMFAKYQEGDIRAGAVGCNHLNQWLAAVKSGAVSLHPHLCEPNKNTFCATVVASDNAALQSAISDGLKWCLIKWSVEEKYEELPAIMQRALNVEHHIGEGDLFSIIVEHVEFMSPEKHSSLERSMRQLEYKPYRCPPNTLAGI